MKWLALLAAVVTAPLWAFELLVVAAPRPHAAPLLSTRLVDAVWAFREPPRCREVAPLWGASLFRPAPCGAVLAGDIAHHPQQGARYELASRTWLSRHASRAQLASLWSDATAFGRGTHGLDAGARAWFGKPADELDSAQLALLLAMAHGATPDKEPQRARELRGAVITRWRTAGFIDDAQMTEALRAEPERTILPPPL